MNTWKIKNLLLQKRCDVCHKEDLFNPSTNTCERCSNRIFEQNTKEISFKEMAFFLFSNDNLLKVVSTFFFVGMISAFFFGQITKKTSLVFFYTKIEYWRVPTLGFWIFAGICFLFGLIVSYVLVQRWLPRVIYKSTLRQIAATLIIPTAFPIMYLVAFSDIYLLLSPVIGSLLISLALWLFTNKWYKTLVCLMAAAGVSATFLANIILVLFQPYLTFDDFEILRFSIGYSSLASLCGYWLNKAGNN